MDSKLFKGFTPFINRAGANKITAHNLRNLDNYEASDPEGSEWRRMGFMPMDGDGEFSMDVQGAGLLCVVQLNERILPGANIREAMYERIRSITEREGRKPGKKEYAQVKDEVTAELLPRALLRRKVVPVLFTGQYVLVFTTSAKLCDDVVTLLFRGLDMGDADDLQLANLEGAVANNIDGVLTTIAREGGSHSGGHDDEAQFVAGSTAVLKGEGKQSIRIKDKDVTSHDISKLLEQEYVVTQLGLDYYDSSGDTDPACSLIVNDRLCVSRFVIKDAPGNVRGKDKEDAMDTFLATAWLVSTTAKAMLGTLIGVMGGVKVVETNRLKAEVRSPVDHDEDDL